VLPLVIDEQQVFTFKFWFGNQIHTGMHFQNELFCQLGIVELAQRSQLYQRACKLTHQGVVLVITCSKTQCRIWGSLRDDTVKQLLVNPAQLQINGLIHHLSEDSPSSISPPSIRPQSF